MNSKKNILDEGHINLKTQQYHDWTQKFEVAVGPVTVNGNLLHFQL